MYSLTAGSTAPLIKGTMRIWSRIGDTKSAFTFLLCQVPEGFFLDGCLGFLATFMMSLHYFFLLVPYLGSTASYSDCESPTQVAPPWSHMEIRQTFSTFEHDSIHFKIHCKVLLSLWGPSGPLPCPSRLSCCKPTCPHAVSGQLINSWVCLENKAYARRAMCSFCGCWIMQWFAPARFTAHYTVCF